MLQLKANSYGVGVKAFLEYQNLVQNILSMTLAFAWANSSTKWFLFYRSEFWVSSNLCNTDWKMGSCFPLQDKDQWNEHVFLLRRRTFSDILERVVLEYFSGSKPPDPQIFFHHFCIFLIKLAHDKISTSKIKVLCLPYSCNVDWGMESYFPFQNKDQW